MTKRTRALVRALTPIVAVVTMMIGLGVGARKATRAAIVFGAAPGRPRPGGDVVLAWQVRTALSDRGVREALPGRGVRITARSGAKEARWRGRTNDDGVAEASLAFEGLAFGDPLELDVQDDDGAALARGPVTWGADVRSPPPTEPAIVRPTKIDGDVRLDVVIDGDRLVPGFPVSVWVRPRSPGAGQAGAHRTSSEIELHVDPEPGLSFSSDRGATCDGGWAEFHATAHAHVVGATFSAVTAGATAGSWFGALPVAPGAFDIDAPRTLPEGRAAAVPVLAPNPRKIVYLEIDDDQGRVAAAAQDLRAESANEVPRATFALPPLARGTYRIFASGDPSVLEGSFIGRTVTVGDADSQNVHNTCIDHVAASPGAPPPRWIALDGFATQAGPAKQRRTAGIFLSVAALAIAAIIEIVLLVSASREAKRVAERLATEDGDAPYRPSGSVAVNVLVVLLGFTLLAALILTSK